MEADGDRWECSAVREACKVGFASTRAFVGPASRNGKEGGLRCRCQSEELGLLEREIRRNSLDILLL